MTSSGSIKASRYDSGSTESCGRGLANPLEEKVIMVKKKP